MPRVLILCSANSIRSPLAEGVWRELAPDWKIESCGAVGAGGLHSLVQDVLAERGSELENFVSRSVSDVQDQQFDVVITLSDEAHRKFPQFPGATVTEHWPIADPMLLPGPRLNAFRLIRDDLLARIEGFLGRWNSPE